MTIKLTERQEQALIASVSSPDDSRGYGVILRGSSKRGERYLTEPGLRSLFIKGLVAEWRSRPQSRPRVVGPFDQPDSLSSIRLNKRGIKLARELTDQRTEPDWQPEQVRVGPDDEGRSW